MADENKVVPVGMSMAREILPEESSLVSGGRIVHTGLGSTGTVENSDIDQSRDVELQ